MEYSRGHSQCMAKMSDMRQFFWGYILPRILNLSRFKTTLTLTILEVFAKELFSKNNNYYL